MATAGSDGPSRPGTSPFPSSAPTTRGSPQRRSAGAARVPGESRRRGVGREREYSSQAKGEARTATSRASPVAWNSTATALLPFPQTGVRREPTVHWRSRPSSGADMHCRAGAAPRSPRIRERGLPAESGARPQSGHIGPPVGLGTSGRADRPGRGPPPIGPPPTTPRGANWRRRGITAATPTASDVAGFDGAPLPRVSSASRCPGRLSDYWSWFDCCSPSLDSGASFGKPPRSPCPARRASDPSRRPRRAGPA